MNSAGLSCGSFRRYPVLRAGRRFERLWRHLKRTGVANHLFRNSAEFMAHLLNLLARVNGDSDKITGIVFKTAKAA